MADSMILKVRIDASGSVTGAREFDRAANQIDRNAQKISKSVGGLSGAFGSLRGLVTSLGLAFLAREVVRTTVTFENLRAQLETVYGSATKAQTAFNIIKKFAAETPFQVDSLTEAWIRLRLSGFNPTLDVMRDLGDIAGAMGKDITEVVDAARGAAVGETERLKTFGISAKIEGEKITLALGDMSRTVSREIGSVVGALREFSDARFEGGMERLSKTLGGAFSNLEDSAKALMDRIAQSGLSRELDILARQITETANTSESAAARIGQGLSALIGGLGLIPSAVSVVVNTIGAAAGSVVTFLADMSIKGLEFIKRLVDGWSGAAKLFGFGGAVERESAALQNNITLLQEMSAVSGEFANTSGEQLAGSLESLTTGWDELTGRIMAGTEASEVASGSLDDLAGSGAKLSQALDPKAAKEFAEALQDIVDEVSPASAAYRVLVDKLNHVREAYARGYIVKSDYLFLTRELTKSTTEATDALFDEETGLFRVASAAERLAAAVASIPDVPTSGGAPAADIKVVESEYSRINQQFSEDLRSGVTSAFMYSLSEFARGGEITAEQFKDMLIDVLLQAVERWLTAQLAAIAEAAAASKAISGGSGSGSGGGGWMSSLFGGGGSGAAAGAMSALVVVAVVAGIAAWARHERSEERKKQYDTTVTFNFGGDLLNTAEVQGRLHETGRAIADGLSLLVEELENATGSFIEGAISAQIKIRHDKKAFQAIVEGELIGTFDTAEAAIIAAAKRLFQDGNLSQALDPLVSEVIRGFDAGGSVEDLIEAVNTVQQISDELSGLTDIEIALRNLPQRSAAFAAQLVELGVSMQSAEIAANQWTVSQLQNIRDQITGRQRTEAEERAERERQALFFNAQLALMKAETQMKRDKIAADILALKAQADIAGAGGLLAQQELEMHGRFLNVRADQLGVLGEVYNGELGLLNQFGVAAFASLQAQLALLDQALAALNQVAPISPGEINVPNIGGGVGGGYSGPSEAEQIAQDIAGMIDSLLPILDLARGGEWHAAMMALNRELARNIELAHGDAEAQALAQEAHEAQIEALEDQAMAVLGLPTVEATRRFEELAAALEFLQSRGELTAEQMMELGNQLFTDILAQMASAIDDQETLAMLEEARYDAQKIAWALEIERLNLLGVLTQEQYEQLLGYLNQLPDDLPGAAGGGGGFGGGYGQDDDPWADRRDELMRAIDRLRSAIDSLREFQEGLSTSDLSPLTIEQQFAEAQARYLETLAAAQAGDLDAIEALPGIARLFLDLAGQMYDTSGAGYADIFDMVSDQITAIIDAGQAVLDAVPSQMLGTEERLDTVIEISAEMALLLGVIANWNPYTGGGTGSGTGSGTIGMLSQPGGSSAAAMHAGFQALSRDIREQTQIVRDEYRHARQESMKKPQIAASGWSGGRVHNRIAA